MGFCILKSIITTREFPDGVAGFVPGSPAKWDVSLWGWDLLPSDWVSVTYQAVDGNRAYYGVSLAEISEVNLWLTYGPYDWMWGNAEPDSTVTAERDSSTLFTAYADPACGGCWGLDDPLDINPGDVITLTAGAGVYPVTVEIPDPLTAYADAETEEVWGQIGGWLEAPVEVLGNWEDGYREIETDASGDYSTDWVDPYTDIPKGGDGYIRFRNMSNWADIIYRQYFREPSFIMRIHYDHDWIEGNYAPGHDIHLTVYDSGMSEKAHTTVSTGPIDEWEGQFGFATWLESTNWDPDYPDIQPGDIVHGEVDDGSEYTADVKVGLITGTPNEPSDSITGTVLADVNWPSVELDPVDVTCSIWESDGREVYDMVVPNGVDTYTCVFEGENIYDIVPGTNLMVSYFEPEGHQVFGDFSPPAPYLLIEKWFIGESPGVSGNAAFVVRYRNQGTRRLKM